MEGWAPTFVVGVDFGMTCTGVAYSSADWDWGEFKVIQEWPDTYRRLCNKYPTRVGYNGRNIPVDWGECNKSNEPMRVEREFKLYLDPAFRDDFEGSPSHDDAVKYYKNYMRFLHDYIEEYFTGSTPNWNQRSVEYRFSVPTTWKNPRLIEQLKGWLKEAGFVDSHNRRVLISQTEAEAAAVYAAKHYQKGDIIMVVDAGGATTDINILEVQQKTPQVTKLKALYKAEGINVGSVLIDTAAKRRIQQRLRAMHIQPDEELLWMAEDMMEQSGFETFKCSYDGGDRHMDHSMEIPDHPNRYVIMKAAELRQLFEPLIQDLIQTIHSQITSMQRARPYNQLRYIVLSGGLGSSKYIKRRLNDEFCAGTARLMNANNLQILAAEHPQLAVVKGLVMDRSQEMHGGGVVYTGKCCRVSYGVVCRLPYDARHHRGENIVKDEFDKSAWVDDQIDWLIKEGEVVPEEGLLKRYSLKVPRGDEFENIYAHLVMSEQPAHLLPRSRRRGPTTKLCTVTGKFNRDDFVSDQFKYVKRIIHKEKEHYITQFDLKVIVGSADLGFELVSMDGRRYSQNTAKVNVQWSDVPIPAIQPAGASRIYPVAIT